MKEKKHHYRLRFCSFAAICLLAASPMLLCGELLRMKTIAKLQPYLGEGFLYGSAYSNTYSHYKYAVLTRRNAGLVAMGDSRVLQFKADFFKEPNNFYNAGTLFVTPHAFLTALRNIPEQSMPKTILLGIDHSTLTKTGAYLSPFDNPGFLEDEEYKTINMLFGYLAKDRHEGKFTFWEIMQKPNKIGVMAKLKDAGFKQDGSYYYGDIYHGTQTAAERIEPYMKRVREGSDWFVGAPEIWQDTLDTYAQIADFCKERGIDLIAFAPPFSPTAYEVYKNRGDTQFLDEIDTKLAPVFTSRGFEFYNYTDPAVLHLTDEAFIDAFHGSDVTYLRILRDMLRRGSRLAAYADDNTLAAMDAARVSELVLREGL